MEEPRNLAECNWQIDDSDRARIGEVAATLLALMPKPPMEDQGFRSLSRLMREPGCDMRHLPRKRTIVEVPATELAKHE